MKWRSVRVRHAGMKQEAGVKVHIWGLKKVRDWQAGYTETDRIAVWKYQVVSSIGAESPSKGERSESSILQQSLRSMPKRT